MAASEDVTSLYDRIITSASIPATAMGDLLDEYTHTLAEMIREELGIGGYRAADLIDPYRLEG